MGYSVSFLNMKGGVSKTTLCASIGYYLANYLKMKILFIDLDPQFNLTQSYMNEYDQVERYLIEYRKEKNIRMIFTSVTSITEKPKIPTPEEVIVSMDPFIDLIPGTIDLIFEDNNKNPAIVKRVKKFIADNNLKEKYDFIFIDCPPTISMYTDAGLIASDYYLVPVRIDRYSILGMTLLNSVIDRLNSDELSNVRPIGAVYTAVERNVTDKAKELMQKLEQSKDIRDIRIFSNRFYRNNDLLYGKSGNIATKYKRSFNDIKLISEEFLERINSDGQ